MSITSQMTIRRPSLHRDRLVRIPRLVDVQTPSSEPDPRRRRTGRAAAVGLSLVVTVSLGGKRALVRGRRRIDLAANPELWHIVASGMLELSREESVVWATAQRELSEEVGVALGEQELRPSRDEYTDRKFVELVPAALARFWHGHPPTLVTPAAAGAIALIEETSIL